MSGFTGLVKMEWKRYRAWQVSDGLQGLLTVAVIWLGLAAMGGVFTSFVPDPRKLLMAAVLVWMAATLAATWMAELRATHLSYPEWWLALPYKRRTLVLAKFAAHILIGVRMWTIISLAVVVDWAVNNWGLHAAGWGMSAILAPWTLACVMLSLAAIPVCAGLASLVLLFSVGTWRIGNALFGLIIGLVSGVFGVYVVGDEGKSLTVSFVNDLVFWVVGVGWPLAVVCLILASFGVRRLSRGVRRAEGDEPSTDRSGTTLGPKRIALFRRVVDVSRRPLHPLLVFEWSRLDLFGRRRPIAWRRSAYAFMLFLGVSGFAMGFSRGATAAIPGFWMDVSEMFMPMLVTQFIVGDLYRGAGLWWLGFPYSRGTLLFFRGIAGLTANFAYSVLGFLCIAVGLALHYLLFRLDLHALAVGWSYVWHVTLACLLLNPIVTALGFATSALTRGWRAALAVLIYMVGYSGIHFYMMGFVFSTDILSGPRPVYWSALGMTLLVGIPLAWVCFRAGVRNVHNFITMKMWGQTARQ